MALPYGPGSIGPEIKHWQGWLQRTYQSGAPANYGVYGDQDAAAVRELQRGLKITETGVFDAETALKSGYEPPKRLQLSVEVVHGDLSFARHPLVVGHYEGDTIIGAEALIDALLDGALSQRYSLGVYPGEFGSLAMVLRTPTEAQARLHLPAAAMVLGLGRWGELTSGQLADLLRRAALQYVLAVQDRHGDSAHTVEEGKVGLSVLLIGGNSATNIGIADSVGAILRGIAHANRELADEHFSRLRIDEVEIIELYADLAIEAAHACKSLATPIGNEFATDIAAAPQLKRGRDGRARLTATIDCDAWRRWEVSVVTPPEALASAQRSSGEPGEPGVYRELRFLTLSDRARAEAVSQQRQPELIERLIQESITQAKFRAQESRVLFELMVPNDLKSGLAQIDNLVMVLDAESAAYPWELMSDGEKPLCVAKALVRQLQTARFRPQISARAGKAAYIVGDPLVSPPREQLRGAAEEGDAVYELLRRQFEVKEPAKRPTALSVLAGLYEKPYRIVHLAGHGQYEPPAAKGDRARSGLVLDNGVFLTAVEIGQMQQVPELVFINCCYLGQTGLESGPKAGGTEYNRLAASISRELIEMGVRAVVAAGWAVNDVAGPKFAEIFYKEMLSGEPFGRALQTARTRIHDDPVCGSWNTWGAYQAYGDPDYRLDPKGARSSTGATDFVDPAELIEAVRGVSRRAATTEKSDAAVRAATEALVHLVNSAPPEWQTRTDVLMEVGLAHGDLGQWDEAVERLRQALEVNSLESAVTLRSIEQLANYESRLADRFDVGQDRAADLRQSAITRLKNLLTVHETSERYALLGSAYKRVAAAEPDTAKARAALLGSLGAYRRAHELHVRPEDFDPYPLLNWLAEAFVLDEPVPDGDDLMQRCEHFTTERCHDNPTFFNLVSMADARLVRGLRSGGLQELGPVADRELAEISACYRQVIDKGQPKQRELNSVLTQIDLTRSLLEKLAGGRASTTATVTGLTRLRSMIDHAAEQTSAAQNPPPPNSVPAPATCSEPTRESPI